MMTRTKFAMQALSFVGKATDDLLEDSPSQYLVIVQGLIETLILLVEEYEGVLDEHASRWPSSGIE